MLNPGWRRAIAVALLLVSMGLTAKASYIPLKAMLANSLIETAWQKTLNDGGTNRPWSWADHWPVARLSVPSLGVDHFIIMGAQGASLAFAPGAMSGFALPGSKGTAIVGGHRDTDFGFLEDLTYGEALKLQTSFGDWQDYRVTAIDVVDSRDAYIRENKEEQRLLLVTCYPFNALVPGGPLRYVVSTERIL
jgi:sortase A